MMSDTSPAVGCFPTADAVFGPGQDCRPFDFTIAFEQCIFSIVPTAIFIVAALFRLKSLRKSPSLVAGSVFQLCKTGAVATFAALQLALVALWATQSTSLGQLRTVSLAASCVSLVASLIFCALSYVEHARSLRPSFILNAYLLLSLLLDAAIVRSFWMSDLSDALCVLFTASFALKAALLVLEAVEKARYVTNGGSHRRNPEATSGLYSRGVFWWMVPLMLDGFRRLLQPSDLYVLDESMSATVLNVRFWKTWKESKHSTRYRLIKCCLKTLKWPLLRIVVPRMFLLAFTICQPLLLNRFLTFLQDPAEEAHIGHAFIGAYALVYVGIAISSALYEHQNARTVTMLRGVLVSAVFSGSTELSTTTLDNSAAVTLMSTDVDAIIRAWREIHEIWANTIQIGLATWLLDTQIGFACVGPVMVCGLALAASVLSGPRAGKYMMAWISTVQDRIGTTSTMLGHMKSIKMSGLGHKLGLTITKLRQEEIDAAAPFRTMSAVTSAIAQVPLLISPVAAFAFFTIRSYQSGQTLDATRMFSSLSLIILLGQPLFWMLEAFLDANAAFTCFKRIEKYLSTVSMLDTNTRGQTRSSIEGFNDSTAQLTPYSADLELQHVSRKVQTQRIDVDVRNASLSWSREGSAVLKNLSMSVKRGKLAIIVGPVASGKTTLLKGLLGEVPTVTGEVNLGRQKLAWCEQTPWLINDTLRRNIIGFSEYDEKWYRVVTRMCDLDRDFAEMENQDQTLVGSKGVVLSGGQKQRVALARALYSRPQIALFDDPFSGLDSHTARTVFNRLFSRNNGIFRQQGTTVVLATQTANFLSHADQVVSLKNGLIVEDGSFESSINSGGYASSLQSRDTVLGQQNETEAIDEGPMDMLEHAKPQGHQNSSKTSATPDDKRRQTGDLSIYAYFFSTLGTYFNIGLLVCEVAWAFLSTFPTVWLKWWVDSNAERPNQRIGYYLGIYSALQIMAVISFGVLILFGMLFIAARSGIVLHRRLLDTVTRAPLSLFTNTDIGSITTRFSQDIGLIDRSLPLALLVSIANLLVVISQAGLIASSTGYVAIAFPFWGALSYYVQKGYLRTSRQLRLLDLEEKAPVYSQFLETLSGLVTIRAFGWSGPALALNHTLVDKSQRPFYLLLMVQQWLTLVLNLMTAALAILLVGLAVSMRDRVAVGLTGVSLIQLITLAETLKLLIQFWTSLETSLGAVVRIKNFSDDTPDERLPGEDHQPRVDWLRHARIELSHVSASYGDDLEIKALDDLSLTIEAGQKVGIVGRTGSGKSSFLMALLRMLPSSSGSIIVDGIDLSTVPRDVIRARLIVVSQDLFFLPGSVRQNIDPYDNATSEDIEKTMRRIGIWDAIVDKGGLDAKFDEDMLSHGQRQLFSLARAILRKNTGSLVLFDEATSSIDAHTDALMQQFIHEEFRAHTVLSIAHRLNTIADFDRVVILDHGCIIEDGNPKDLMKSSGSKFREMWDANRQHERAQ